MYEIPIKHVQMLGYQKNTKVRRLNVVFCLLGVLMLDSCLNSVTWCEKLLWWTTMRVLLISSSLPFLQPFGHSGRLVAWVIIVLLSVNPSLNAHPLLGNVYVLKMFHEHFDYHSPRFSEIKEISMEAIFFFKISAQEKFLTRGG